MGLELKVLGLRLVVGKLQRERGGERIGGRGGERVGGEGWGEDEQSLEFVNGPATCSNHRRAPSRSASCC